MADAPEQPPAPAPPSAPSGPSEPGPAPRREERQGWRSRPLAKRLPLLILAALGLWLWRSTGTPERQLVFQLAGPGWSDVRALDLQLVGGDGAILKREERFFASGPPPEVTFKVDLPEGTVRVLLFLKREGREDRQRLEDRVVVGEEEYIVRQLRLPPASR